MTFLNKNLNALKKNNPDYYKWLYEIREKITWYEIIKSKNGSDNFYIKKGAQIYTAYNIKNPIKEAQKIVKKTKLYKENISICFGLGLGYLLKETVKKKEKDHRLIVIEPVRDFVFETFKKFDFSKGILNGTIIFVIPTEEQIGICLNFFSQHFVIENWMLSVCQYIQYRPDEYNKLLSYTLNLINQILCSVGTIAGEAGAKIANNDIECLPYVIKHRGVSELRDFYKNKPAVLVSTGPSLAKNIHNLIDNKKNVVIIAVGQALRVLLAYGITPDFICSVDFGEVNMGHFKGLMDSNVPLVTINRTYAPLLKEWQGPKFIVGTPVPGFEEKAAGILTGKGFIDAGGSVAHLCFGFANLLGCDPITFIGQDLALGTKSHIPLADATGNVLVENGEIKWQIKDQRCSLSNKEKYSMGPVHQVEGYYGKTVLTNLGLASFLSTFEAMIKQSDKKIYNSTEGGAKIKGVEQITLKQFLNMHLKKIDKSKIKKKYSYADDGDKLIETVIPLLQDDIENLNLIISNSRKGIATSTGLKTLIEKRKYIHLLRKENQKTFEKLLKKAFVETKGNFVETNNIFYKKAIKSLPKSRLKTILILSFKNFKYSELAHKESEKNPLISVAIYGATRAIQGRNLKGKETLTDFLKYKENALIRVNRNTLILKTAKESSQQLLKLYKKTLSILKKYNKNKDINILLKKTKEKYSLKDAKKYFEQNNWAHPLLDSLKFPASDEIAKKILFKAVDMKNKAIKDAIENQKTNEEKEIKLIAYNKLIKESQETGRKGDFEDALCLLKKAVELMPENPAARWGLATAFHHSDELVLSLYEYQKLISDFPDNMRFKFEYGNVLLKNNEFELGLKFIKIAMEASTEFDDFSARLGDIYFHLKMHKESLAAFDLYLKKYPNNYEIWMKKGKCHIALENFKVAKKAFAIAEKLKPSIKKDIPIFTKKRKS